MEFASPKILWFLLLLIPLVAYYIYRTRQGGAAVIVSTVDSVKRAPKSWRYFLRHIPFVLRCVALTLFVVAIARPQSAEHYTNTTTEGIDIVLTVDVSTSMLAKDVTPDRLSVAKEVASEFIGDRTGGGSGLPFTYNLPNGWNIRLSASPILDAEGNDTEWGIDPDIKVDMAPDAQQTGRDAILDCAIEHLTHSSL